jgi:sugar phosphate isomerase/epimerase
VLARLSLNQKTTDRWSVEQAIDGCVRHGLPAIGLWREQVAAAGLERTAGLVAEAGLRVSSLCRGGFLTVADEDGRRSTLDDNRRAIDEAATLDAACLVLVVGGLPEGSRDLPAARDRVAAGIETLVPYAAERGVRLALEPLHPIYCADRAVLSTLGQALDLAERFPPEQVGVVVDTYHVWWDPDVAAQIARAGAPPGRLSPPRSRTRPGAVLLPSPLLGGTRHRWSSACARRAWRRSRRRTNPRATGCGPTRSRRRPRPRHWRGCRAAPRCLARPGPATLRSTRGGWRPRSRLALGPRHGFLRL